MTLMSVAGIALTSDHTHLVYQRDILKAGTDAATSGHDPATCEASTQSKFVRRRPGESRAPAHSRALYSGQYPGESARADAKETLTG